MSKLDSKGLFYVTDWNIFIDDVGIPVVSIFKFITPNDLFLFKRNKQYMCVPDQSSTFKDVELFYQDD